MVDLLLDVRCLQDPAYAQRGIGRHSLALLRHARDIPAIAGCRLIGLADAAMPSLPAETRVLLDALQPTAGTFSRTRPCCLVQLSPMTHDPLFVGRLLTDPAIRAVAVVYDFIPLDDPDRYLPSPADRVEYDTRLRWLSRYDRFLPISADAARRLEALISTHPAEVTVTGAPLNPAFEHGGTASRRRHILVVGGGDPRKNPELALAAFQQSGVRLPIVITGDYPPRHFRGAEQPGHVSEAALAALYRDAVCVVAPSRAEGFSLPVIEAMAAGVPVLASDIPAHAELVDPARLFPLNDPAALATLLRHCQDPGFIAAALAAQDAVWTRFRASTVAERAWSTIAALLPSLAAPTVLRGARPRLALLTPLPPARSGVADYSAAMCPALGARVELDVFTGTASPPRPGGVQSLSALSDLPYLAARYDRVVSVLGNSEFHWDIVGKLLRYGGACIAHDGRMLDIYAAKTGLAHTTALAERELSRPLQPQELTHWLSGTTAPGALLYNEIAAAADPLMVHSRSAADAIRAHTGTAPVQLPFSIYRSFPSSAQIADERRLARGRLEKFGAIPGSLVIATFGFVSTSKAPEDCLWALRTLRQWGLPARLHFVGDMMGDPAPLRALVTALDLKDHVWFGGSFVDEAVWQDHLLGADAGLQLRLTGAGSVSGALSDCAGAGLRSVASAVLADAIDAPSYVRSVPDRPSPVLVAEALADLLGEGPDPSGHEAARRAYADEHSFVRYADRLCHALGL